MPFQLNGQAYTRAQLQQHAQNRLQAGGLPQWQQDVYGFVLEWLNHQTHITVHTSGSTGTPKAIELDKAKVRNSALMTAQYLGLGEDSNALLSLSANYIAGKMMVVRAIENNWHLWMVEPSNNPMKDLTPSVTIDLVAWVPSQLQAMLDLGDPGLNARIEAIGNIILGGSPVLPQLAERIRHFPKAVFETFGMTETISHIAMRRLNGSEKTDVFETTDAHIILGQDDRDCLVVIAPNLTDKPVITNDIIELKDERHFKWLGRVDNVVNSGGIKLFPETLEQKVQPLFADRFFFAGVPDVQLGQKLVMVIEKMPWTQAEEAVLKDTLATTLTRYEMPRQIYPIAQMEETATHKINRMATLKKLGLG